MIRFVGQPPVQATIYELQKLRCNLCGKIFTAKAPEGVGEEKYDATAASMVALLKYGSGLPFHRLEELQENLEVPLPASTQWEIVNAAVPILQPAHEELIRQAAQGEVIYNDDTTVKILERMGASARQQASDASPEGNGEKKAAERTGLFTSGVVAARAGQRTALFFSGNQHAGENLRDVLRKRAAELPPPIQMCDALSRNRPAEFETILANCLAHARRQFVEMHDRFPAECRYGGTRHPTFWGNLDKVGSGGRIGWPEAVNHKVDCPSIPDYENKLTVWLFPRQVPRLSRRAGVSGPLGPSLPLALPAQASP